MRLRGQLLLAALVVALLPVTAVLFLDPIETLLRAGHEQAVAEAARAAAAQLPNDLFEGAAASATGPDDETAAGVLYLHPGLGSRILDGYEDDWTGALDRIVTFDAGGRMGAPAEEVERSTAPARLAAIRDGRVLELFLRVTDASPRYARGEQRPGDAVVLDLGLADGLRRYTVAPTAPGPLALRGPDGRLLRGHWQDRPDGWSLELRTPIDRPLRSVTVTVLDRADAAGAPIRYSTGALRVIGRLEAAERQLERLGVGPAWWTDRDGWVRAHAGAASGAPPGDVPPAGVLDVLMAARLDELQPWSRSTARVDLDRLGRVDRPDGATRWGRVGPDRAIRLRRAVPVDGAGVLVLERDAGPLLLLANRAVVSWLAASLAVFTAIALLLFAFVLVLALRVRRLRNAAKRAVDEGGRLDRLPAASTARDELGDLSRDLRGLMQRLGEHQRYLQSLADALAHELRTPVSMIQSSLENLEQASDDERAVYLKRAGEGAERLRRIVQAMSQAARLEDSLQREPLRPLDLVGLVREYVAARGSTEAGHRLELAPDGPDRAAIEGSDELLAQLLDKLVDNAVAFTPAGGRIRIGVRRRAGDWRLSVENEGASIEPERAAAIFDSMVRFRDPARARDDRPHLGLGLYIARCIAEFHHGRIEARPVPGGTRIDVDLPGHRGPMAND